MARLLTTMIVGVFMVLILSVSGDEKVINKRDIMITNDPNVFDQWLCEYGMGAMFGIDCSSLTSSTTSSTPAASASTSSESSESGNNNVYTTPAATNGQSNWCQFSNGTNIPLGYTFMETACKLCQCVQSHAISCTTLQCMPTFCIDGSTPSPKPGQCCPQCGYENISTPCVLNGINFPTGTLLRRTGDNVACWCQLGDVECRKVSVSLFTDTAIYVIVIVICAVLIFGTLICCASTVFFFYYYKRRQQAAEQDFNQYYMNAGWQPMSEDGQGVEGTPEEKQAEAEQAQYEYEYPTGNSAEHIPPPYALYNGSYVNEPSEKDPKQT